MLRSRLGLKVIGLCALVLGLMALGAGGAQAETGAHWNIVNASGTLVQVNETNKLFAGFRILLTDVRFLFTTKSGTKVSIACTAGDFDEGGLMQANGGISLGRVLFKGCLTQLNGVTSGACKPKAGGAALGEILTLKIKGLAVLDEVGGVKQGYIKFTPDEGKAFMNIELGEECSIGETAKIEAKSAGEGFWLKDSGGNASFAEEKVEHSFEESLNGLIAIGQPLAICGKLVFHLFGLHIGLRWSITLN